MPQLWVSYQELGQHFDCPSLVARDRVHQANWPRRRCSDGLTRVKLPLAVMNDYIRKSWALPTEDFAVLASWSLQPHAGHAADWPRIPSAHARP